MTLAMTVPDLRDGYVEIGREIMRHGRQSSPRGYSTTELEDVVIEVDDVSRLMPVGVGRDPKTEIGLAEALLLCGGLSSPSLMQSVSPAFGKFLDGGDLHGAYGRRVRPQMDSVIRRLKEDSDSRQAIVTIWDPLHDTQDGLHDTPCTLGFGFRIRDDELRMTSLMRSQDFWLGMAYDLFFFSQLGHSVANTLGIEFTSLRHHVMSLHAYARDYDKIENLHEFGGEAFFEEPTGFGVFSGGLSYEPTRLRAEKIYDQVPLDQPPTRSEVAYARMLSRFSRDVRTAGFTN